MSGASVDVLTPGSPAGGRIVIANPSEVYAQNHSRLLGAGASAHEHFVQFSKILDLAYEADRKMVSVVESLGVRESTSRSGQLGVPIAGAGSAQY